MAGVVGLGNLSSMRLEAKKKWRLVSSVLIFTICFSLLLGQESLLPHFCMLSPSTQYPMGLLPDRGLGELRPHPFSRSLKMFSREALTTLSPSSACLPVFPSLPAPSPGI